MRVPRVSSSAMTAGLFLLASVAICGKPALAGLPEGEPDSPKFTSEEKGEQARAADWPGDPVALLKQLKVRDAEFDNRSVETEQRWVEKVYPRGQIAKRRFNAGRFGQQEAGVPPDGEIPENFEQPHRVRYLLTVREPEVTLERVGDLETMKHPEYVALPNRGLRWSSAGGTERVWSPETNDLEISGKPSLDGMLRWYEHLLEWSCGYGVAKWMESIDSLRVENDRLIVKGRLRLIGDDDSRVEMHLDRDLVLRHAVISITGKGGGGVDEYMVETHGTVRPEGGPPVAQAGHYRRILKPAGKPETIYQEYEVLFITASGRLTDTQYAERTRIEPKSDTTINDRRRRK